MKIVIPTYGRVNRQVTLDNLPEEYREQTYLAVRLSESPQYKINHRLLIVPDTVNGVADTRDEIIKTFPKEKVLMLDDDLVFATRRKDDPTKFREVEEPDFYKMFQELEIALDTYVHVGVSGREGANRNIEPWLYTTRAMRVLGFRADILTFYDLKFGPGTFMCDFYMTLQLLSLGYINAIYNDMVHNQAGSNTAGGCSLQRNFETQRAAAEFLHSKYPQFVTIVKKQTKTSWNGEERYDVRVQWKRALGQAANC